MGENMKNIWKCVNKKKEYNYTEYVMERKR